MTRKGKLLTAQVAKLADCHLNTVMRYEEKGLVKAKRDLTGFGRFPVVPG